MQKIKSINYRFNVYYYVIVLTGFLELQGSLKQYPTELRDYGSLDSVGIVTHKSAFVKTFLKFLFRKEFCYV